MNAGRNSMRGSTLRRWALGAAVLVAVDAGAEDLPQPPGLPPDTEAAEVGTSVVARRTDPEGASAASPIELTAPPTGAELVGKKPELRVSVRIPYDTASLLVLLDGVDVTGLVEVDPNGFRYTPRTVLPGGTHVLAVHVTARDGQALSRELRFATRHTEGFSELTSTVQLGFEGERLADRRESPAPAPTYRAEGDVLYGLRAARRPWESSIDANLWFQNQKLPVFEPPREGLDLASLSLQTRRSGERHAFHAELGDVAIVGTSRSIATLARRGAQLGVDYRAVSFGGFAVNARQLFGFTGGTGIGTDPESNIYGVTTGFGLLDDKLRFSAIHARGGEPGSSFGLFTASGPTRGHVTGYALTANPLPLVAVEAELDVSHFDADASDAAPPQTDEAYALRVSGRRNTFNYQLAYEHHGPDYAVIASAVNRDRESLAASGGVTLAKHTLAVTALRQHDNVDGNHARPRLGHREGALDYGYVLGERWVFGAGYRDSLVASSREPLGFGAQEVATKGATGRVQYARQPWLVGIDVTRSEQDDALFDAGDSVVLTRSISPTYQTPRLSVVPMLSVSTTTFGAGGAALEQRNLSLMLNGETEQRRFGYGLSLSVYEQRSSDAAFATDTHSAELRLSYRLRHRALERPRGDVSLRATHFESVDRVNGFETRDWSVWLTFSIRPQFEF